MNILQVNYSAFIIACVTKKINRTNLCYFHMQLTQLDSVSVSQSSGLVNKPAIHY